MYLYCLYESPCYIHIEIIEIFSIIFIRDGYSQKSKIIIINNLKNVNCKIYTKHINTQVDMYNSNEYVSVYTCQQWSRILLKI